MGYRKLEIWKLARELSIDIHRMSLILPQFELYETGSQIRRSSKSIRANIVEGFGRRHYRNDFIRFIIYSLASVDETIDHLEVLFETQSLQDEKVYKELHSKLIKLAKMINKFLQSVESGHQSSK